VSFRADWLRREEAMKTAGRENRNCWAAVFSIRVDGPAGQNTPSLITWGWKQEKLQRWQKCFLLISPSIELPVADEEDMICRQANSAAIERPVRHNSTLPMAEGPYAKCWLSCIAGLA
jgi:hypothetical protein